MPFSPFWGGVNCCTLSAKSAGEVVYTLNGAPPGVGVSKLATKNEPRSVGRVARVAWSGSAGGRLGAKTEGTLYGLSAQRMEAGTVESNMGAGGMHDSLRGV